MTATVGYGASMSWKDKENKSSSIDFSVNAADYEAFQTAPTSTLTNVGSLFAATAALSKGFNYKQSGSVIVDIFPQVLPTSDDAYRQAKIEITSQDTGNGDIHTHSIPVRDITKFNTYPRTKDIILTVAAGGTAEIESFVTAFNAAARSDTTGNLLVLLEMKAVGRNL